MSETPWSVGLVLAGRYRLVAPVGKGGMGAVWRAEHTSLGTPVAIKLIHPELARRPGMLARFQREAQAAAKLRSVHVVQILDHGLHEGVPYIAMECLDGESLAQRLEAERALTPAHTAQVMAGICRALVHAHRVGIVHRDLKPDNVFLAREETATVVKVLDFGIAKLRDAPEAVDAVGATVSLSGEPTADAATEGGAALRTATGTMLGTPRYMSPEQALGRSDLDGRSDLWSLAVIAFECLTGARPFQGTTAGELVVQICAAPIPVPSTVGPVPEGFDAWFAHATQRDPAQRFQTAREFANALADVLTPGERWLDAERDAAAGGGAGRGGRASDGESAGSRSSATPATPPSTASTANLGAASPPSPPSRRTRLGLVAGVALAAAALAGLAARRGVPAPPPVASATPAAGGALGAPGSVLACPILAAEGVYAPAGWLGAAVAHHACMRATWLLGGRTERTRVPAELLGLAATPTMDAPLDPFGATDARGRTIEAAKRASAYLDGRVVRTATGYEVELKVVDSASGSASAAVTARGPKLFVAADEAIEGLVSQGALPTQPLDPEIVRVYDLRTAVAGWIFDDNTYGHHFAPLCERAAQHAAELGAALGSLTDCHGVGGLPRQPPLDPRTVGTLVMTTFANPDRNEILAQARPLLEERLRTETTPAGKVLLLQALAITRLGSSTEEAEQLVMEAVRASPRAVDWGFLGLLSTAPSRVGIGRAAHAWNPRNPFPSWIDYGLSSAAALPFLRRSWELDGFNTMTFYTYAKVAILAGRREEASAVVGACRAGPAPYRPVGEAISARLEIEDGRFAAGEKRLLAAVLAMDTFSRADNRAFTPLFTLLGLAHVLGNAAAIADPVVEAFILADPPRATFSAQDDFSTVEPILAYCVNASPGVAKRCLDRLETWQREGKLAKTDLIAAYLAGGRAYAQGDVAAALKAWRPIFRVTGAGHLLPLDALTKVDPMLRFAENAETVAQFLGVPVTTARDARRAARKGEKEKARALAELVVSRWRDLDAEVPAVREMERLLVTLK